MFKEKMTQEHKNKIRKANELKGVLFKKGNIPWINDHNHPKYQEWKEKCKMAGLKNKGRHYSPATEFKKGNILSQETLNKQLAKKKGITFVMRYGANANNMKKLKGKTYEQIYRSPEKALEEKAKRKGFTFNHTQEAINKMKISRSKLILPLKDTAIEIKIQGFLTQLGIEFYPHQYIKEIEHAYSCDIFIPSMNLIIECDGDYWHGNPLKYMFPSREQYEQQLEDIIRTKELLEVGYKVLRLWEMDIKKMNLDQFKEVLNT